MKEDLRKRIAELKIARDQTWETLEQRDQICEHLALLERIYDALTIY